MKTYFKKALYWLPRGAGVLFALFYGSVAFDVFDDGLGFRETTLALFAILLPSIYLVTAVVIAWKWEWAGALLFVAFAYWLLIKASEFDCLFCILVAGLPGLIGLLFLAGWLWRAKIRDG